MSGKYLHGLLIDNDFIDVRDNIFSHSELRQTMTQKEQKHPLIQEWSWNYVTRQFTETPNKIIQVVQKWIDKNLSTHTQLISWINRNWEGLVNKDEPEREFYIWSLIDTKAKSDNKLIQRFLTTYTDRNKADAEWEKAYAEWEKADAEWEKAYTDRKKADTDREKADADRNKAYADRNKADAGWKKADAEWKKADADRKKAYAEWNKAYTEWEKAYAEWNKAYAEWEKADADRKKADTDREKADADRNKAYAEWNKADADRKKAYAEWEKADADRKKADAEWEKADKKWKTNIMKPVFLKLLKEFPNKCWEESEVET
jgi:hypothetical protein